MWWSGGGDESDLIQITGLSVQILSKIIFVIYHQKKTRSLVILLYRAAPWDESQSTSDVREGACVSEGFIRTLVMKPRLDIGQPEDNGTR